MRLMKSFTGPLKNTDDYLSIGGKNFCSSAIILQAMSSKILGKVQSLLQTFVFFPTYRTCTILAFIASGSYILEEKRVLDRATSLSLKL